MKTLIAALLTLVIPFALSAEWKGPFEIHDLVLEGTDQSPIVNIALNPSPQTACTDNTFSTMETSSEMGVQALSVLLAAASAGKAIKIYIDGCAGARPKVRHVWLIAK